MKKILQVFSLLFCFCTYSQIITNPDTFSYTTSGTPIGGSSYNVLTNDSRRLCSGGNNVTIVPLTSNFTLTGSATTPPYFTILPNGNIFVDPNAIPGGSLIPSGQYNLTYQICDTTNQSICFTIPVTINVTTSFRLAADVPKPIIKPKEKITSQSIYQVINFPDANLKAKLLEATDNNNIAFNIDNTNIVAVDTNDDGEIDTNEALQIGRVNLDNANISNLTGMEYFINLKTLRAHFNTINTFNTVIPGLQILSMSNNPLSSINVTNLPSLERLFISDTQISSLNSSFNPLLYTVNVNNTSINSIDLGVAQNLTFFYCSNNPNLTSINIKNTSLLDYSNTFMQQDCWRNCPNLNYICADSNEVPVLQSFLANCGVNTSGITIDSACALGIDTVVKNNIVVYPNPSSGIFMVDLTHEFSEYNTVTVYDVLGKKVHTAKVTPRAVTSLNLTDLAKGYYTAQFSGGDRSVNVKLIRQ
jgi:hypothetical protein